MTLNTVEMRFQWTTARPSCSQDRFTFSTDDLPSPTLAFPSASTSSTPLRRSTPKRTRPRADVDGEGSGHVQKKKRRLRLDLITSRLSRPYAFPTTHIVSRGRSKVAIWARQKAFGGNLLRKAAIMNLIRIKSTRAKEAEQKRRQLSQQEYEYDEFRETILETMTDRSRRQQSLESPDPHRRHIPLSPSPLGLTNYDVLDQEGDPYDDVDFDTEGEFVNSDWNILEPTESEESEDDDYDSFAPTQIDSIGRHPVVPSEREILDLVTKGDTHQDTLFAQFGPC